MTDDDRSPGWEAIDEALAGIYGDVEPKHYGTIMKWKLGGPDPLDGVSIYESTKFDVAHWHYVGYGLTELYEKESNYAEESGWGFELTFRLRRDSDDPAAQPPVWPINLMQNLARYVFESRATFAAGHHMNANGPISVGSTTELTALLFVEDPELAPRDTPHGKMSFVQIVGITAEELAAAQAWSTKGIMAILSKRTPGWVTDLARKSVTANEESMAAIREGIAREGSSMAMSFTDQLGIRREGDRILVTLGALGIDQLRKVIPGRLRFDRTLVMMNRADEASGFVLQSGPSVALVPSSDPEEPPTLTLPPDVVTAFAERLEAKAGRYDLSPHLTIIVEKTVVKSSDGKEVIRTVG